MPEEGLHNYEKAEMGQPIGFGESPAVLAIDLCLSMTDPSSPLGMEMDACVDSNAQLIDAARRAGVPVIYTTVERPKGYRFDPLLRKVPTAATLEAGGPWKDIDPRVEPSGDEPVIVKWFSSAFFGTPLLSLLIPRRIDTLVVTGTTTSGCVRATVADAVQYGYRVILPRECIADRAEAPHEANLFDMQMKMADVVSLEYVMERFARTSPMAAQTQ